MSASQSGARSHGGVDFLRLFYLIWKHLETALCFSSIKMTEKTPAGVITAPLQLPLDIQHLAIVVKSALNRL